MIPRALVLLASVGWLAQASLASAQTAVTSSGQGPMVVERVSDGPAIMPEVKITEQSGQYGFNPTMLTVAKGTKVTWTNASDAPHNCPVPCCVA